MSRPLTNPRICENVKHSHGNAVGLFHLRNGDLPMEPEDPEVVTRSVCGIVVNNDIHLPLDRLQIAHGEPDWCQKCLNSLLRVLAVHAEGSVNDE